MKLSQLTSVAWCANMMLDRREQSPFTLDEIYAAVDRGALIELFLKIDDSGIIELSSDTPEHRVAMERAFGNAVEALRGRELRKTGVGDNPLCFVIAIALEAIQQNFSR